MTDWKQKSRLEWTDANWAAYLGCSVSQVSRYKEILNKNYLMAVEKNTQANTYAFAMYRYDIAPSGQKRLRLLRSSNQQFSEESAAITDANNIISTMELYDFYATALNVPKQAIQMLLIRQK